MIIPFCGRPPFLASDGASGVNGAVIEVSGGDDGSICGGQLDLKSGSQRIWPSARALSK